MRETLADTAGETNRSGIGTPGPGSDLFRASLEQRRTWLLEQLSPGLPTHSLSSALRFAGKLDLPALRFGLNALVRRHQALRTCFDRSPDGDVMQRVTREASLSLAMSNLELPAGNASETEIRRLVAAETQNPFNLERGPLFRAKLMRLDDSDHILLLTAHCAVADEWSMRRLERELMEIYAAQSSGRPATPAAVVMQYAEYEDLGQSPRRAEVDLEYWKRVFGDIPPVLDLPTDRPRPPVQTFAGARRELHLPLDLRGDLEFLAAREGTSLFAVVLAGFAALLFRYTDRSDLVIGTRTAGRTLPATEALVGPLANTLALRLAPGAGQSFRQIVHDVRKALAAGQKHQATPFGRVLEVLNPERDLSRTPLFQIMGLEDIPPPPELTLPELRIRHWRFDPGTSAYDITLSVESGSDGLRLAAEHNTDLFDGSTAERMLGHLGVLLEGAVATPDNPLENLPVMGPAERHRVLVEWNATTREFPRERLAHELFEEWAKRLPDVVAVEFGDDRWTYGELERRAELLAIHLRRLGVGPGVLVGVLVERSLDLPLAILGTLKAGGAYLPLDPGYPVDRLGFMFEDSRASVLLTQERLLGLLPSRAATVVCLDRDWPTITDAAGVTSERRRPGPDDLAYVIYTSGSTGRPKGTELCHRGLCSLVMTQATLFGVHRESRMLQFSALSFDASVWECFLALGHGARLVLAPTTEIKDPQALAALLDRTGITVTLLPPSMLAQLPSGAGRWLETLVVGGEACPPALAAAWASHVRLVNAYGPTEGTVTATAWEVPGDFDGGRPLPIGRPVPNAQTYVLDRRGWPTPTGTPGELYVGGVGLARGYLGRPELTAERFVPDPFGSLLGQRLYRTGDLVRHLPGGEVEFLGRIDDQVKVRGFRVELGEIETVLARHPALKAACVATRGTGSQARLVAYVVPVSLEAPPSAGELRAFLGDRLPEYMVPTAFVILEAMPLTPSGKVDRRALPEPEESRLSLGTAYLAPRTPLEEALAAIWTELLGLERVGVDDSFFELGGQSLLATRLVARAREVLQVEVPLTTIFASPTVAGMAAAVVAARAGSAGPGLRKVPRLQRGQSGRLAGLSDDAVDAFLAELATSKGEES